jgi:hypothetical protein
VYVLDYDKRTAPTCSTTTASTSTSTARWRSERDKEFEKRGLEDAYVVLQARARRSQGV